MKAQIYIITTILILMLFLGGLSVSFYLDGRTKFESDVHFKNLLNSAAFRKTWLDENWYSTNWSSKMIIRITGGDTNPALISNIPASNCEKEIVVIRKADNSKLSVNVNQSEGPCDINFYATTNEIYEIYYNSTIANENNNIGIVEAITHYTTQLVDLTDYCTHFKNLFLFKNIDFVCSVNNSEKPYLINYTSSNIKFSLNF
ncbi:MAG: hypothetical protein QXQ79_00820 [Candidatus Nanoarchaeia archaeon]